MLEDGFMKFVVPITECGCLIWMGALNNGGYGNYTNRRGLYSSRLSHRIAYEDKHGPIPDGLVLDHLCRIRCCVNPDHLEPVTHAVNLSRGFGAAYQHRNKSLCKKGHQLSGANIMPRRSEGAGWRRCRECEKIRRKKRYWKDKI
jgi:hypothetical protein